MVIPPQTVDGTAVARTIWSTVPILLVEVRTCQIRGVSKPAAELFGYPLEQMWGMGIDALVPEGSKAAHLAWRKAYTAQPAQTQMVASANGQGRGVVQALHANGSIIPLLVYLYPQLVMDVQCVLAIIAPWTPSLLAPPPQMTEPVACRRILIVEDNPADSRLASTLLQAVGHETQVVINEDDAVQAIEAFTPDLVIMDILLSGGVVSGIDITRRITQKYAHCKVLLSSGLRLSPVDVRLCGAVGAIWKPIDLETFASTIQQYLDFTE